MKNKSNLIFYKGKSGRVGASLPDSDVDGFDIDKILQTDTLKSNKIDLPQLSEPEVVRHFTNLSTMNHHIDKGFYPLGSCTMKYNPKINDTIASYKKFSSINPNVPINACQGSLQVLYELGNLLVEITGMDDITLQPSAGSQGELVGILIMQKYHQKRNNKKTHVIIPDSAHGTNPASVVLGGYNVVQVGTDNTGRVDIKDLKSKVNSETAGMMLTQPNTLGLFENKIEQISDIVHDFDGLMYMDGANLNALVGIVKPGEMGFDITHINVHKTFSTPHGGGGPGAGPIAVVDSLSNYLPIPKIVFKKGKYSIDYDVQDSIGQIHSFFGNFLVLLRAYCYILTLGKQGLEQMSRVAIINANYLKSLLDDKYEIPYSDGILHEFVISAVAQKNRGIKALDIAKSLLDYGYHSPTIYFPINVPEAIMIEPTESETIDTLNDFANAMNDIDKLIDTDPEKLRNSPVSTPVSRLNETFANRNLDVRFNDEA